MQVDVREWRDFNLLGESGIFKTYERGKISVARNLEDGSVPYVGAVFPKNNNGIVKYVAPTSVEQVTKGNCLVMVCDGAAIGCNMYQSDDFVGTVNLKIVRNEHLNEYVGLYLASVLDASARQMGYSYFWKRNDENIRKEKIKLPVTPDGEPDWSYMESYMRAVMDKQAHVIRALASISKEKHPIDIRRWRGFRVGELFDIHPTKAYSMTNVMLMDGGNTPVVVNSGQNNGVGGHTTQEPTEMGNIITFSDTTDASTIFYQPEPFVGYPHVQGLYPVGMYAGQWSELRLLFFSVCFKSVALGCNFDYGNKFRRDIAVNMIVYLPITSDGHPDWDYMDRYMRQVMDRQAHVVSCLQQIHAGRHCCEAWSDICG